MLTPYEFRTTSDGKRFIPEFFPAFRSTFYTKLPPLAPLFDLIFSIASDFTGASLSPTSLLQPVCMGTGAW
jgi:hypothetical protein